MGVPRLTIAAAAPGRLALLWACSPPSRLHVVAHRPRRSPPASEAPAARPRSPPRPRRTSQPRHPPVQATSPDAEATAPQDAKPQRPERGSHEPSPRADAQPTPSRPSRVRGLCWARTAGSRCCCWASDARGNVVGDRTDTIMFVTIDPSTGRVAMASLPRDMVLVPIGTGEVRFGQPHQRPVRLPASAADAGAAQDRAAMEYVFDIEIDRYAMIGFYGVRHLINHIGGVDVRLDEPLFDLSCTCA